MDTKNFINNQNNCDNNSVVINSSPMGGGQEGAPVHVQLGGQAFYDEKKYFMFCPDDPVPGQVQKFRRQGIAQQMADGTFDFVVKPQLRSESELIRKLAHGRASRTKDNAIQLTLKVYRTEGINISEAIRQEAIEAAEAIREYQLRH